jgi:transposase
MQPGVSMAAVALSHGVNANLLRRWVREAEMKLPLSTPSQIAVREAPVSEPKPVFVPLSLPALAAPMAPLPPPADIRIELRRGATTVTLTWPASAASQCADWMRELLR